MKLTAADSVSILPADSQTESLLLGALARWRCVKFPRTRIRSHYPNLRLQTVRFLTISQSLCTERNETEKPFSLKGETQREAGD